MNKKLLFMPLVAAMAFTGCTSDEPVNPGNSGDSDTHYLAVSIIATPTAGGGRYTETEGAYENGTAEENTVNKVRFYFFTATGNPSTVKKNSTVNYMDCTPTPKSNTTEPTDNHETVSNRLDAVLMINTNDGDKLPAKVVAVINPPSSLDGRSLSLPALGAEAIDFTGYTGNSVQVNTEASPVDEPTTIDEKSTSNGFVMSNAVFVNEAKSIENATVVDANFYAKDEASAKEKPLKIYVERTVAKVRVNLGSALTGNQPNPEDIESKLIKLQYLDDSKNAQDLKIKVGDTDTEQQVYIDLKGWNISGDLNKGRLLKDIQPGWTTTPPTGFDASWNLYALHRCFWANYCTGAVNRYDMFRRDNNTDFSAYTYCNENAEHTNSTDGSPIRETDVIIPAIICDASGNPLNICEFAGYRVIDNETFATTKTRIITMITSDGSEFWTEETSASAEGSKVYRTIKPEDIKFEIIYDSPSITDNNRYYVKASWAEQKTWYKGDPSKLDTPTSVANWSQNELNDVLAPYNTIKVWNKGQTYYYLEIPHFANKAGVVRNHLYNITIDGIYGLGTPVFDSSKKIIPEKVTPESIYIAAQVNILDWRIVSNNVSLDWGK